MANEKRLIDANAVLAGIDTFMQCYAEKEKELTPFLVKVAIQALEMVRQLTKEMSTVDAVEVVHGRWRFRKNWDFFVCSECSYESSNYSKYCPNCGAKMDGERKDNGKEQL